MKREHTDAGRQAGFTLVELLVAMTVTLLVLAGTLAAMTDAMRASETAKAVSGMNGNLRVGMDMMVRDFIQTGQGLPAGLCVEVGNTPRLEAFQPRGAPTPEVDALAGQ